MKCFCICLSVVHAILKYMNIHKSMYMIVYAHVRCMFFNDTVKHKSKQEAGSTCSPFRGSVVSTCIVQDKIIHMIWRYLKHTKLQNGVSGVFGLLGHHFGSLMFHQRFHRSKIWGADVQVPKIKLVPTMVATSQDAVQCRSFFRNRKIQLMRGSDLKWFKAILRICWVGLPRSIDFHFWSRFHGWKSPQLPPKPTQSQPSGSYCNGLVLS